jgi:predicted transcriptional regulator
MNLEARRLQVDRFILEQIDSVPHLEGLLQLFNSRPKVWSAEEMAAVLYVRQDIAAKILETLHQRDLISADPRKPDQYFYSADVAPRNQLLESVNEIYRRDVVRISSMIHSKASAGVRDFARAFRIKKDKE